MQADLILYAIVAAGLVFWLKNVLGTRHGDERERPNPFTANKPEPAASEAAIFNDDVTALPLPENRPSLPRNVTLASPAVEREAAILAQLDPSFDLGHFAQGAQDAFALIVESFAAGDRDTLRNLLETNVFDAFNIAMVGREQSGETMSTEIHAVRKCEILEIRNDGRNAFITARFIADETCLIKDKNGAILSGDPDRITEMNDIWTFTRQIRSRDPRWLVSETRDGDVKEEHKTPVPDVH